MKKNRLLSRFMAWVLTIAMTVGIMPVSAIAEGGFPAGASGEVISFAPLDGNIAEQSVPYATDRDELNLPVELTAAVRVITPSAIIITSELPESGGEATPGSVSGNSIGEPETSEDITEMDMLIPVTWDCPDFDGCAPGTYTFTAKVGGGFTLLAEPPVITVMVADDDNADASPQVLGGIMTLTEERTVSGFGELQSAINVFNAGSEDMTITVDGSISITAAIPTITNSGATLTITGGTLNRGANDIYMLQVDSDAKLVLTDIILDGQKGKFDTNTYSLVYVNGGTLTMNSGALLTNNRAPNGGGVYVYSGTFTMSGGAVISGNTATDGGIGGGVYVASSGSFKMTGGEISGNTAGNGGGVRVNGGTFTMSGGLVFGRGSSDTSVVYATSWEPESDGNGIVIRWSGARTIYPPNYTTDLYVLPESGAEAYWSTSGSASGIYYKKEANGVTNEGFIPLDSVTVTGGNVVLGAQTIVITAPATGIAPQSTIAAGTGYTGTIEWYNVTDTASHSGVFAAYKVYKATVTLASTDGYQWPDTAPTITVDGQTVTNTEVRGTDTGNKLIFDVEFPATEGNVVLGAQTIVITAPATGIAPQSTIAAGTGYTGTIEWYNVTDTASHSGVFAAYKVYKATVTLTSTTGYQWPDTAPAITVDGQTVTNTNVSGTGTGNTLTFDVTFAVTATGVNGTKADTTKVYMGTYDGNPAAWYVIGADAATWTLLAEGSMGTSQFHASSNAYATSTLKTAVNNLLDGLSDIEKEAMNDVDLTDVSVSAQKLWPLSIAEANLVNNDLRNINSSTTWWLRSSAADGSAGYAATVGGNGAVFVGGSRVSYNYDIRPAFELNLSSVLFTSDSSENGAEAADTSLKRFSASETPQNLKLTLNSGQTNLNGFSITPLGEQSKYTADNLELDYSTGANDNHFIRVQLSQNGETKYTGVMASGLDNAGGTASIPLTGVDLGTYDVKAWVEQGNAAMYSNIGTTPVEFSLTVVPLAPPTIVTASLPDGLVGTAYNATLEATGGGITWSLDSGTLPTGLDLDAGTGVISGTPSAVGTFNFTVKATNETGEATAAFSIAISKQDGAAVSTPTAGSITENGFIANAALLTPTGQDILYAVSTNSTAPGTWVNGATFDNLTPWTEYYIFAKSAANNLYDEGDWSVSTSAYRTSDTTAPEGEVKISTNTFKKFLNTISFGLFFKTTQTVTVTAEDNSGQTVKIEYFLSATKYTDAAALLAASPVWTEYEPGGIDINPGNKYYVYVKLTDLAGNTNYIASDGVVVFIDSAPATVTIDYTKGTSGGAGITLTLNDNTIKAIKENATDIGSVYSLDTSTGVLTFTQTYLDTLPVGATVLTVYYNPLDESYVDKTDNEEPAVTVITINVTAAEQSTLVITDPGAKAYGDSPFQLETTGGNGGGAVTYAPDETTVTVANQAGTVSSTGTVTITKAGTIYVKATKAADGDYNAATSETLAITVNRRNISGAVVTIGGTYAYDGTAQTPATTDVSVTLDGGATTLTHNTDYTYAVTSGGTNVGTAAVTVTSTGNYTGTATGDFDIGKAAPPSNTATHTLSFIQLTTGSDIVNLGNLLPALSASAAYGTVDYEIMGISGTVGILIEPTGTGTVTSPLTVSVADTATDGQSAEITVKAVSENYQDITITITVNIVDMAPVNIGGLSIADTTFNNSRHPGIQGLSAATFTLVSDGSTVTIASPTLNVLYTGTANDGTTYSAAIPPTKAGSYTVTVTLNDTRYVGAWTKNFVINKAAGSFGTVTPIDTTYTPALTLSDLSLPSGYAWDAPATALSAGNGQTFAATFTDSGGNYNPATGNVTVNVAKATGAAVSAPSIASKTSGSITINAASAPSNGQTVEYAINTTNTSPASGWQTTLTFSGLNDYTTYYIFARSQENNNYNAGTTASLTVTTKDGTAPTGTITIRSNGFSTFLNTITFGLFFKDTIDVTVTGADSGSGVKTVEYYESSTDLPSTTDWNTLSWMTIANGGTFSKTANWKGIVYARITDNEDNAVVIRSDGVVVYTDSEADTQEITHIKFSGDKIADVTRNGNTIDKIMNGSNELARDIDYTVDDATITFKEDYLNSLMVTGDTPHTLTVHYNPMGLTYVDGDDNEAPETTGIALIVNKATVATISTEVEDVTKTAYEAKDAATAEEVVALAGLPSTVDVSLTDGGTATLGITWATSTDYNAKSAEYNVTGILTGTDDIDAGSVTKSVKVTVTAITAENPTFGETSVAKNKSKPAATADDLGTEILPTSGVATVEGETVGYTIEWSGTLNMTQAGNNTTFSGIIRYTGAPWLTPPISPVTRKVTVTPVTSVAISGVSVSGADKTYDGTAVSYDGTPVAHDGEGDVTVSGYTYNWQKSDGTPLDNAPKEAGSYKLVVSVADTDTSYVGSQTIGFTIRKAAITITADNKTATVGDPAPAYTYTVDGLASGESLKTNPELSCTPDMGKAGTYPIMPNGAEVPDGGNYEDTITYVNGTLHVQPAIVTNVTVSFHNNGGSGSMTSVSVPKGSYTLPSCTFSRSGYSFAGWKIGNDGTTYAAGTSITVAGDITLYAQWAFSDETFTAVTNITGVPTKATVGTNLTLSGTVVPSSATNKTIQWTVKSKGSTGATISNGRLRTTGSGTAVVTATIKNGKTATANYTKDFTIKVTYPVKKGSTYTVSGYRYKVTSITNSKKEVGFVGLTAAKKKTATTVNIGNTVKIKGITMKITAVGKNALKGNKKVRTVKIGNNVQTIRYGAFSQCTALKTVTIGTGLRTMEGYLFSRDTSLKTITIKSTKLKSVKSTHVFFKVKATVKVPASNVTAYRKLLKGKKGSIKVTK